MFLFFKDTAGLTFRPFSWPSIIKLTGDRQRFIKIENSSMKYLKIHTLNKGEWYDRDTILLHAAFQILTDFIEQEKPEKIVD